MVLRNWHARQSQLWPSRALGQATAKELTEYSGVKRMTRIATNLEEDEAVPHGRSTVQGTHNGCLAPNMSDERERRGHQAMRTSAGADEGCTSLRIEVLHWKTPTMRHL